MKEKENLDDPFLCEEQCEDREPIELPIEEDNPFAKEVSKDQQDLLLDLLKEMNEILKNKSKDTQ